MNHLFLKIIKKLIRINLYLIQKEKKILMILHLIILNLNKLNKLNILNSKVKNKIFEFKTFHFIKNNVLNYVKINLYKKILKI